jgi:AcrR family transcriptional regulator
MNKRIQQTDRTRIAILEAASEMVFGTANPEQLTMQNVADAAGVSHRTLYRYFASRQELINAVGASYDKRLESSVPVDILESFEQWTGSAKLIVAFGATHTEVFQRGLALSAVAGQWRTDRDEGYWKLFRERFPNLEETVAREDFALLRHVLQAANALLIGQRFQLTPEQTAAGIERAVQVLTAAIAERDAAAASEESDS